MPSSLLGEFSYLLSDPRCPGVERSLKKQLSYATVVAGISENFLGAIDCPGVEGVVNLSLEA
ncbi:hypothetical protein HH1059_08370 [Halorhodospira halochloris]|uniref:Uncharacterized protein n=1 Tax=Halorhodospira halochloris TaxID=1052 RepID=A0A2Z6EZE1_HALHR|nr:hypothetical protein HH1059_08370 [Halorhodospira halochloris]